MNEFIKKHILRGVELISKPIPPKAILLFRRFFVFKVSLFAFSAFSGTNLSMNLIFLIGTLLFLATLNACAKKIYWPGTLVLFFCQLFVVLYTFPYTVNHHFLELFLLFLILLFYIFKDNLTKTSKVDGTLQNLILFSILSLWFYSGIQKIFNGYWINGEMLTFSALYNFNKLGEFLRYIIGQEEIAQILGMAFESSPYLWQTSIPFGISFLLLSITWIILLSDLLLPILVIFRRTRIFALISLFFFQITIGIYTNEISFMFTGLATLLLFFPKKAKFTFPVLFVSLIIYIFGYKFGSQSINMVDFPLAGVKLMIFSLSLAITLIALIGYYFLIFRKKNSKNENKIKNFFKHHFSQRLKKRLIVCILIFLLLWPVAHIFLANYFEFSPWRFGGWGMYSTIHPNAKEVEAFLVVGNDLVPMVAPSGYGISPPRSLISDIKTFNKKQDIEKYVNLILEYPQDLEISVSENRLLIFIIEPRVNLLASYTYANIDAYIYDQGQLIDFGDYNTDKINHETKIAEMIHYNI